MTKTELLDKLRAAEREPEKAQFSELVQQCVLWGNLTDIDISRAFSMSRPGVKGWMEGKNLPMPQMWKAVFSELHKRVQEKA